MQCYMAHAFYMLLIYYRATSMLQERLTNVVHYLGRNPSLQNEGADRRRAWKVRRASVLMGVTGPLKMHVEDYWPSSVASCA